LLFAFFRIQLRHILSPLVLAAWGKSKALREQKVEEVPLFEQKWTKLFAEAGIGIKK
jgi:hypothetical protein